MSSPRQRWICRAQMVGRQRGVHGVSPEASELAKTSTARARTSARAPWGASYCQQAVGNGVEQVASGADIVEDQDVSACGAGRVGDHQGLAQRSCGCSFRCRGLAGRPSCGLRLDNRRRARGIKGPAAVKVSYGSCSDDRLDVTVTGVSGVSVDRVRDNQVRAVPSRIGFEPANEQPGEDQPPRGAGKRTGDERISPIGSTESALRDHAAGGHDRIILLKARRACYHIDTARTLPRIRASQDQRRHVLYESIQMPSSTARMR